MSSPRLSTSPKTPIDLTRFIIDDYTQGKATTVSPFLISLNNLKEVVETEYGPDLEAAIRKSAQQAFRTFRKPSNANEEHLVTDSIKFVKKVIRQKLTQVTSLKPYSDALKLALYSISSEKVTKRINWLRNKMIETPLESINFSTEKEQKHFRKILQDIDCIEMLPYAIKKSLIDLKEVYKTLDARHYCSPSVLRRYNSISGKFSSIPRDVLSCEEYASPLEHEHEDECLVVQIDTGREVAEDRPFQTPLRTQSPNLFDSIADWSVILNESDPLTVPTIAQCSASVSDRPEEPPSKSTEELDSVKTILTRVLSVYPEALFSELAPKIIEQCLNNRAIREQFIHLIEPYIPIGLNDPEVTEALFMNILPGILNASISGFIKTLNDPKVGERLRCLLIEQLFPHLLSEKQTLNDYHKKVTLALFKGMSTFLNDYLACKNKGCFVDGNAMLKRVRDKGCFVLELDKQGKFNEEANIASFANYLFVIIQKHFTTPIKMDTSKNTEEDCSSSEAPKQALPLTPMQCYAIAVYVACLSTKMLSNYTCQIAIERVYAGFDHFKNALEDEKPTDQPAEEISPVPALSTSPSKLKKEKNPVKVFGKNLWRNLKNLLPDSDDKPIEKLQSPPVSVQVDPFEANLSDIMITIANTIVKIGEGSFLMNTGMTLFSGSVEEGAKKGAELLRKSLSEALSSEVPLKPIKILEAFFFESDSTPAFSYPSTSAGLQHKDASSELPNITGPAFKSLLHTKLMQLFKQIDEKAPSIITTLAPSFLSDISAKLLSFDTFAEKLSAALCDIISSRQLKMLLVFHLLNSLEEEFKPSLEAKPPPSSSSP